MTFRLIRTAIRRGGQALRDLSYAYDPAGNVTAVNDSAQPAVFFANTVVERAVGYTYDATYRLVRTEGREHQGQVDQPQPTWDNGPRLRLPHPHDGLAMRRYTEFYEFDVVGNLQRVSHQALGGNWTRLYDYLEPSPLEPGAVSNRLTGTSVGSRPETYLYDAHGNLTSMPHLPALDWDHSDRLRRADLGGGGTAWYCYDFSGRRVRSVVERLNGTRRVERRDLGGVEVFREYDGAGTAVTLERQTLHVAEGARTVARVETRTVGTDPGPARLIRYPYADHLGSASLELDGAGQVISAEEYYPWGATSYQAVRSQVETPNRYRYLGRERDEETGFTLHGDRYYAPWLGRWTAPTRPASSTVLPATATPATTR